MQGSHIVKTGSRQSSDRLKSGSRQNKAESWKISHKQTVASGIALLILSGLFLDSVWNLEVWILIVPLQQPWTLLWLCMTIYNPSGAFLKDVWILSKLWRLLLSCQTFYWTLVDPNLGCLDPVATLSGVCLTMSGHCLFVCLKSAFLEFTCLDPIHIGTLIFLLFHHDFQWLWFGILLSF